jgi:predicted NBD/HSP70 family sugar kinase
MMQRITDKKADQLTIRRLNMAAILKLLRERGTLARADLAKELGMTRNTASNIVNDLLNAGLVVETKYRRERAGRPGLLLELAPTGGFAVAVEIDISRMIALVIDFKGTQLWEEASEVDPDRPKEEIMAEAEELVRSALDWGRANNLNPLGIGLGLAGLVDAEGGELTYAPTLKWEQVPFKAIWEERFSLPVHLDNEANTSALGYHAYADRFTSRNLCYLSIGAGMAAGLILDGHLFRGSGGFAGQAGHMKIKPEGTRCSCGDHGCWVTEVGLPALSRKTGQKEVNLAAVVQRLRSGDTEITAVVNEMAEMLGLGIANMVNLFNIETVVLGGALRPLLPFMIEQARATVQARALPQPGRQARIKVSGRDDDSVYGAACLVLDAIMNDPVALVRSLL